MSLWVIALPILLYLFYWLFKQPVEKPKEYGIKSTTYNGELVKSVGEKQIADYLSANKINYVYEPGLRGIYADPDFYLPDYGVYVEYWGLVDADNPSVKKKYTNSMRRKMAIYHKNKIKFISIYPHNLNNLNWVFRKKFEEVTGYSLHQ